MTLNGTREDQVERMKNAEKIEALREWVLAERQQNEGADDPWNYGYLVAIDKVLRFIDPPRAKWREDVDERLGWAAELPSPLGSTLRELADLEYSKVDSYADPTTVCLARIVAICEQEVGDGWQADPDDWPDSWDDPVDVWSLLDALCDTEDKWQSIGDRAATWLRSLTDGGAA